MDPFDFNINVEEHVENDTDVEDHVEEHPVVQKHAEEELIGANFFEDNNCPTSSVKMEKEEETRFTSPLLPQVSSSSFFEPAFSPIRPIPFMKKEMEGSVSSPRGSSIEGSCDNQPTREEVLMEKLRTLEEQEEAYILRLEELTVEEFSKYELLLKKKEVLQKSLHQQGSTTDQVKSKPPDGAQKLVLQVEKDGAWPKLKNHANPSAYEVICFIDEFERKMRKKKATPRQWCVKFIECIEGPIKKELEQVNLSSPQNLALMVLKKKLGLRWRRKTMKEMEKAKQAHNEPISFFATRFKVFLRALGIKINSREAKRDFVRAVLPHYASRWEEKFEEFEFNEEFSIDTLVEDATKVEGTASFKLLEDKVKAMSIDKRIPERKPQTSSQDTNPNPPTKSQEDRSKLYCTNCKKFGHLIDTCWLKGGGQEGKGPRQQQRGGKKKEDVRCYACNQLGHYSNDPSCPKRKDKDPNCFVEDAAEESELSEEDYADFVYDMSLQGFIEEIEGEDEENRDLVPIVWSWEGKSVRARAIFDNGSTSRTFVDTPAFERLPGKETSVKLVVHGLGGSPVEINRAKKVMAKTTNREVELEVYAAGIGKNRVILSRKDGEKLGISIQGIPLTFPDICEKRSKEDDEKWIDEGDAKVEKFIDEVDRRWLKESLKSVISRNQKLPANSVCNAIGCEYVIKLKKYQPIFKKQYPIAERLKEKVMKRVQLWIDRGWVVKAHEVLDKPNLWNSPLLPADKVSGGVVDKEDIRLCLDPRALNEVTEEVEYTLPTMSELFDRTFGSTLFTELDLESAFHQIPVHKDSQPLLGFTAPDGVKYVWIRMPFGPKGAPTHFQRVMDMVMVKHLNYVRVYIDNLLVHGNDLKEHAHNLKEVIEELTRVGFRLNLKKSKFGMRRIKFMGVLIDGLTKRIDAHKLELLAKLPRPSNAKQMSSLLGFTNFLREFIPKYESLTGPLEEMKKITGKFTKDDWTEERKSVYERLKRIFKSAPILYAPNWNEEFIVASDASQFGVGAVLYQVGKGKIHHIEFFSKAFKGGQRNYPAPKRELLALVAALHHWRPILYGRRFRAEVDQKSLTYLHKSKSYMILDWLNFLLEFNFYIIHKKGINHVLPDILSRLCHEEDEDDEEQHQKEEVVLFDAADLEVEEESTSEVSKLLVSVLKDTNRTQPKEDERLNLIKEKHKESHIGAFGLYTQLFREGYYWRGMRADCDRVAKNCRECLLYNVGRKGFHPISPITASLPFDHIVIDLIGQFPTSPEGYNFVLIVVDVATRFLLLRPIQTKAAEEIAWVLLNIFANFGLPKVVQYDRDRAFLNKVMDRLRESAEFVSRAIMKYFPRTNGAVERHVMEVKQVLLKLLRADLSNWEKLIPVIQLSLNDRIVARHKSSPFACMFARRVNGARDYSNVEIDRASEEQLLERNRKLLTAVYPELEKSSKSVGELNAAQANKGKKPTPIPIGAVVMKCVDVRKTKLQQRWEGPFVVAAHDEKKGAYRLTDSTGALLKSDVPAEHLRRINDEVFDEEENVAVVKEIRDHRGDSAHREYLVKWKGIKELEWVPAEHFYAHDVIREYWLKKKKREEETKTTDENDSAAEVATQDEDEMVTRSGRKVRKPVIHDV
jgi:hypothetical protein